MGVDGHKYLAHGGSNHLVLALWCCLEPVVCLNLGLPIVAFGASAII